MIPLVPLPEATTAALAQAMLHFLWQGAALWLLALCLLQVVRGAPAEARYALYGALLAVLALCPAVTFWWVLETPAREGAIAAIAAPSDAPAVAQPTVAGRGEPSWTSAASALVAGAGSGNRWLVALWLAGTVVCGSRLALAACGVVAIRRRRRPLAPGLVPVVDRIARPLAFRRRPEVCVVDRLGQAVAVGFVKPLVLLPASWVCGLPGDVLEVVIAHELAHLRRCDLAINALQRVVECALFFHPVVWWCSRRLRVEREICCDAVALRAVGSRARYAKGLTFLAAERLASAEPLLAAGIGGPKMLLLERIRHVLDSRSSGQGRFYGLRCASAGAAAASIVWSAGVAVFYASSIAGQTGEGRPAALRVVPPARVRAADGTMAEVEDQTRDFMFGSIPAMADDAAPPSEQHKAILPAYTIEPPDILFIEAVRVVPKQPYVLRADDALNIHIRAGRSTDLAVARAGNVELTSFPVGEINVAGLTEVEAAEVIRKALAQHVEEPSVSVRVGVYSTFPQPIAGEHLVAPDGNVNLGSYGQVFVAGMTVEEAKKAIDDRLASFLDKPNVSVSVFAYNSKVYYVISEGTTAGDTVARFPITGNETVLDALSQTAGLSNLAEKKIWIARPARGATDSILPVDWKAITEGASAASNYQVLPGDRIFVAERPGNRAESGVPVPGRNRMFTRKPLGPGS